MRRLKKLIILIGFFCYNRIYAAFRPLDEYKVLFLSENRRSIRGNMKAVLDAMSKEHPEYKTVVRLKDDRRVNTGLVKTLETWREITTSKFIVLDDFYTVISTLKPRPEQEIIQLWHGSGAYKKFGYSRASSAKDIKRIHSGYSKYTMVPVSSEAIRRNYAEAFGIPLEQVLPLGNPRTDIFFQADKLEQARERVYSRYPKLKNHKVVLIAPTFRGNRVEDANYNYAALNANNIQTALGTDYVVAVKWHPALTENIRRGINSPINCDKVIDLSEYEEMNDLLAVTEVLVTDYSSIVFDWYFMNRKIVYFVYDLEEYAEGRGLYYPFEDYVYGQVVTESRALVEAIKENKITSDRKNFGEKFLSACDGKATQRVVEYITER